MSDPYQSPKTTDPTVEQDAVALVKQQQKRAFWKKAIWFGVLGIAAPIILGVAGMIVGMMKAFSSVSEGSSDPGKLADNISTSMLSLLYGSIFSILSLIFLIIAIIKFRMYKPKGAGRGVR